MGFGIFEPIGFSNILIVIVRWDEMRWEDKFNKRCIDCNIRGKNETSAPIMNKTF